MANGLKKIPGGITPEDFLAIKNCLLQILNDADLQQAGVKQVIMRLNKTDEDTPWPVFVGWVQDDQLAQTRVQNNEPDPGLFRFADDNRSKVYNETLAMTSQPAFNERVWGSPYGTPYVEKTQIAKALGPEAGAKYQRYMTIVAGGRRAGTLSVGLLTDTKPSTATINSIDQALIRLASGSQSPVVTLLQDFALGGPAA